MRPSAFAVLKDDAPFSSVTSDGSVSGILTKYFQHIGEIIGAKIEFVPYGSKDAACAALKNGEVDAVGKMESDIFDANENKIILSNVYLRMSMVQITKVDYGSKYCCCSGMQHSMGKQSAQDRE